MEYGRECPPKKKFSGGLGNIYDDLFHSKHENEYVDLNIIDRRSSTDISCQNENKHYDNSLYIEKGTFFAGVQQRIHTKSTLRLFDQDRQQVYQPEAGHCGVTGHSAQLPVHQGSTSDTVNDSQLLDIALYPNATLLNIDNVHETHSGQYQCRANSPAGAIMSTAANIQIRESPDDFCADSLQQKAVALPSDCVQEATNTATFEVGECIAKSCRQNGSIDVQTCGEDSAGNPLTLGGEIEIKFPENTSPDILDKDFKLWSLNTDTGVWEVIIPSSQSSRRKKRQFASTDPVNEAKRCRLAWYPYRDIDDPYVKDGYKVCKAK
ncbi:CILP1-like protein, partial [Mya arenaria]